MSSCPHELQPTGSSVHGISQARILGWVAISFSRDWICVSALAGIFFTSESPEKPLLWFSGQVVSDSLGPLNPCESEVTQSCPTLCDPMNYCSLPGSSIHRIFQARVLEWVAISFSSWTPNCSQINHFVKSHLPPRAAVSNLFGTRDRFRGGQSSHGLGHRKLEGWFWFHQLLTSCCTAWFLTGHGQVIVHGLGIGEPCSRVNHNLLFYFSYFYNSMTFSAVSLIVSYYLTHESPGPPASDTFLEMRLPRQGRNFRVDRVPNFRQINQYHSPGLRNCIHKTA